MTRKGWAGAGHGLALICAVLAVLLQVNAPIRMALLDADPLAGAVLCAPHQSGSEHQKTPDALHHDCGACAVCSAVALGLALLALGLFVPSMRLGRPLALVSDAGPRGPPIRRPRARGPPAYA